MSPPTARVRVWRALERLRRELVVAGAIAAALAILLAASPAARAAARALLDLVPGVTVVHVDELAAPAPDVAPPYAGEPTTLDRVQATLGFGVRRLDAEPDAVWARNDVRGGMVTLVYGAISVTEWQAAGSAAAFEVVGGDVDRTLVGDATGLWVDGRGRAIYTFVGADALPHREAVTAEQPLLLWQRDGIAFRLAGATTLEQALAVAERL